MSREALPTRELKISPEAQLHGEAEVPAVCGKLRTKMAFLPLRNAEGEPLYWQKGDGSTSVYWCLHTMECAGPDGGLVHASLCGAERFCFQRK